MNDEQRLRWVKALTTSGWLFVIAYLGYLISQIRRAFQITNASFEDGLWWQRIEQISFASLPQNVVILAPAAAAAVGAAMLIGSRLDHLDARMFGLVQLVRAVAGSSVVVIVLALLGIGGIYARTPDDVSDLGALLGRSGGIAMAVAMIRICLEAERSA